MKKEYNSLTRKLLAEGYTADNHPDYVYVGKCCQDKDNPLQNLDGGFRYYSWYTYERTFRTPCGLQCKGTSCMTGLYRGPFEFTFENDMATIKCPYHNKDCMKKNAELRDAGVISDRCNVYMTDEDYQYEGSVEGILKLEDERIRREKISFDLMHHGRTCENHMHYDYEKGKWEMHYNPLWCANGCYHGFMKSDENGHAICPILGRTLDPKKGNVYYDVKIKFRRYDLDGTLFEGQVDTQIEKGIRFLNSKVSMDICRNIVKLCKDEIEKHVKLNKYHKELFFAEYYGREFSVEVLNIRAEQRESRDLMQDLQDIRDGISISHESDRLSQATRDKKERREKSRQKRIAAMEKKILSMGYGNMEAIDQHRACKLLSYDRIDELEAIREENLQKEQEKPMQLSLLDFMAQDGGGNESSNGAINDKKQ